MLSKLVNNYYFKYLFAICAIVGGYLVLILTDNFRLYNHLPSTLCFFKWITTIPCPGCGMGRATLTLLHGDILGSFSYNILCIPFTVAIIVALGWMLKDLYKRKETFFEFMKQEIKMPYKFLLICLILIDWATNIARHI